jgi:dolichyl-diphosphooligosaccharide--protein glycosyltransferase
MKIAPKHLPLLLGIILPVPLFFQVDIPLFFVIGMGLMIMASAALLALRKATPKQTGVMWVIYLTLFIAAVYHIAPSYAISQSAGTILTDNWWQALNWIKENTAECATVATYWDPGHFIRAIAKRPIVFDGATQNSHFVKPDNESEPGLFFDRHENGIVQITLVKNGTLDRARIKDIGISLLTTNESLAVEILKDYRKPGCNETYFLATSDLIFKSVWWSYFATWDPTRTDRKGDQYSYAILQQARRKPIVSLNAIGYEYPVGQDQSFILCQTNGTITPCTDQIVALFQAGPNFARVERLMWSDGTRVFAVTDRNPEIRGSILLLDSRGQTIVYMPPELQDSMFTKMFFLNGAGLQNFELVGSWGGEVKLFRIKFDDI